LEHGNLDKFDSINSLIPLSVIPLRGTHCSIFAKKNIYVSTILFKLATLAIKKFIFFLFKIITVEQCAQKLITLYNFTE